MLRNQPANLKRCLHYEQTEWAHTHVHETGPLPPTPRAHSCQRFMPHAPSCPCAFCSYGVITFNTCTEGRPRHALTYADVSRAVARTWASVNASTRNAVTTAQVRRTPSPSRLPVFTTRCAEQTPRHDMLSKHEPYSHLACGICSC